LKKYGLEKTSPYIEKTKFAHQVSEQFDKLEIDRALHNIFTLVDEINEYVQKTQPWKTGDKKVLYEIVSAIKDATILLSPFLPETAEKIAKTFNFKISWKDFEQPLKISKIKKADILFRKI